MDNVLLKIDNNVHNNIIEMASVRYWIVRVIAPTPILFATGLGISVLLWNSIGIGQYDGNNKILEVFFDGPEYILGAIPAIFFTIIGIISSIVFYKKRPESYD